MLIGLNYNKKKCLIFFLLSINLCSSYSSGEIVDRLNAQNQYRLGWKMIVSKIKKDRQKAITCFKKSSESGYSNAQYMYDGSGRQIGKANGNYYYNGSGRQIGKVEGNYIYDGSGHQLGKVDGNYVYDGTGHQIGKIDANYLYNGSGRQIGKLDGDYLYDGSGHQIGKSDGFRRMQIIIFFYFFM